MIVAAMAVTTDPADARHRRKRYHVRHHAQSESVRQKPRVQATRHHAEPESYNPRYADVVMDAKTGMLLHQAAADSPRHPASLTKMMTLYLLFEQMESGKVKPSTTMEVSEEAASQAPTKLGLKPGSEITVDDAIKGLVTRSANDAAVVIAEALGGSESEFARQMTRKAHALGMTHTVYRNASGLPDDEQVTTARDQATLGVAIQQRFPVYYRYFSTPSFVYHGVTIRNHNHLIGSVPGVDGIKTGYTRASGFNLVTSLHRADRHIVAVVMGGYSGGQRDARMRQLIDAHVMEASVGWPTTMIAEASPAPKTLRLASAASTPAPAPAESTATIAAPHVVTHSVASDHFTANLGSNEPIKPIPVKTVTVRLAATKTTHARVVTKVVETRPAEIKVAEAKIEPKVESKVGAKPEAKAEEKAAPPHGAKPGVLGQIVVAAGNAIVPSAAASERPRSGWAIQVGAFEEEGEAKQRLTSARSKAASLLGRADPYTERTHKGEKTYYRARFAGFDRDQAESACKVLKRSDIVCMALKI